MYILGINEALGASAAILKNGEIVAGVQEERFTRIKNNWGFPKNAIQFCLDFVSIKPQLLDLVVLSYEDPYPHFTTGRAEELPDASFSFLKSIRNVAPKLEYHFPPLSLLTDLGRRLFYSTIHTRSKTKQIAEIAHSLQISPEKIISCNHQVAHAYTAYFGMKEKHKKTLVLTCDGAGDQLCATVSVVKNGNISRIASTPHTHSLGLFYASITSFLGLKAHEDEYKVMGLAPYAQEGKWQPIYNLFKQLIWVEELQFKSTIPARHFGFFLLEHLTETRFDYIATAAQKFFEDIIVEWVKNAVIYTKIDNLAVAGGVFLNVKTNQKIGQLKEVKTVYFAPSPGDDTNAFGACYYGARLLKPESFPQPLTNMYIGPEYLDNKINNSNKKYSAIKPKNISKTVAQLLARGEIVARFEGRMEFGARALGNRSILAGPRNIEVVEKINRMIKMRDFWMPFAPTILDAFAARYLINPKNLSASHMILSFDITNEGKQALAAAIHPYDKTVRPQVLKRSDNPPYFDLIVEFKKLTGIGAVLNTSFNIHGEPIVCTPHDALSTFIRSGLKYLQLNDILISKRS